jgi:hypothetical protein
MDDQPDIPVFEPFECSLGTVVETTDTHYHIARPDGVTIGVRANGEPSAENVESDIANPAPEPVSVPVSVSPAQLRIALLDLHDIRDGAIYAVMSTLPQDVADRARILWEFAGEVRRDHSLVPQIAGAFDLTDAQVDEVFIYAASK